MIKKKYLHAAEHHIPPHPTLRQNSDYFTPPITMRAATSRLVGLYTNKKVSLSLTKLEPCDAKTLYPK
jgi:hypothetical protein